LPPFSLLDKKRELELNLRCKYAVAVVGAEKKGFAGLFRPGFHVVGERVAIGNYFEAVTGLHVTGFGRHLKNWLGTF
jgi:hypothetical protein